MLKRLHVQNFRCLKDVALEFDPLTVLVGANGTGKSTLMRAMQQRLLQVSDFWQHRDGLSVQLGLDFDDRPSQHEAHKLSQHYMPKLDAQVVQLDIPSLRELNQLQDSKRLSQAGTNLTNTFASLPRPIQADIARELAALVPSIADVYARPAHSGAHRLIFQDRWSENVWYEPNEVSDGTMLVLTYLLLRHQVPMPELLAIEEPERGLHPYLLGEIVKLLRKIAKGELGGKAVQVVLATHSAELLNHVHPEEVRFLSRRKEDGNVVVESVPLGSSNWRDAFREYDESLGSMWLSGGLGGVPGS